MGAKDSLVRLQERGTDIAADYGVETGTIRQVPARTTY